MAVVMRKKPEDQLDYDLDFERWLSDGDTLLSGDAVAEDGITVEQVQLFGTVVKVWLSGGTDGHSYEISVTATTAQGRVKEECFMIRVRGC